MLKESHPAREGLLAKKRIEEVRYASESTSRKKAEPYVAIADQIATTYSSCSEGRELKLAALGSVNEFSKRLGGHSEATLLTALCRSRFPGAFNSEELVTRERLLRLVQSEFEQIVEIVTAITAEEPNAIGERLLLLLCRQLSEDALARLCEYVPIFCTQQYVPIHHRSLPRLFGAIGTG
jgi:hypothetical protein